MEVNFGLWFIFTKLSCYLLAKFLLFIKDRFAEVLLAALSHLLLGAV